MLEKQDGIIKTYIKLLVVSLILKKIRYDSYDARRDKKLVGCKQYKIVKKFIVKKRL